MCVCVWCVPVSDYVLVGACVCFAPVFGVCVIGVFGVQLCLAVCVCMFDVCLCPAVYACVRCVPVYGYVFCVRLCLMY